MVKEHPFKQTLRHLAEESFPPETDLWPGIQEHLEGSKMSTHSQPKKLRLAASIVLFGLLALVIAVFATPQGQAWAQSVLGFFDKAETDVNIPTPIPHEVLGQDAIPTAIQNIEQESTLEVMLPTKLPEGWTISVIEPGTHPGEAHIEFSFGSPARGLDLYMQSANELDGTIWGPEGEVETVQIGEFLGEFVSGAWLRPPNNTIIFQPLMDELANLEWSLAINIRRIRWQADGVMYWLIARGGEPEIPGYLSKVDLIMIGESLAPASAADETQSVPETFVPDAGRSEVANTVPAENLDVADLLTKVDFPLLIPSVLPENYAFSGWSYEAAMVPATLEFDCGRGTTDWWAFWITQAHFAEENISNHLLHSFVRVGQSAQIETVMIGDVVGEYVQGDWLDIMDPVTFETTRQEWNSNLNTHNLVWVQDGILYWIHTNRASTDPGYAGPCRLDKEDLVAFANSLK
jgi:hypothetical protein